MTGAKTFLHSVWPDAGFYCIAMPYSSGRGFEHKVFKTIDEAVDFSLLQDAEGRDVYFNIHALIATQVYDPKKKDNHGTEIGGHVVRVHANMRACRCFFADLDVGSKKPYTTQVEAIRGLEAFLTATKLPRPTVVSSGYGIHIYWPLTVELPSQEWFTNATKLKSLANAFNLHIDPTRITDRSSVLRVPGTRNYKNRSDPRNVEVKHLAAPVDTDDFIKLLDRSAIFVANKEPAAAEAQLDGKVVSLLQVGKACGVVRKLVETADRHSEPEWHAILGVLQFVQDGRAWAHKISSRYPGYSHDETEEKIDRVAEKQTGPTRCQRLFDLGNSDICNKCWYREHREKSSPNVAARRIERKYAETETIPPPPAPYKRLDVGGVMLDQDGVMTVISPFDIYPYQLVEDHSTGEKVMHADWNAELPRRGVQSFRMSLRSIQDSGALAGKLADKGVILQHDDLKHMRHYMTAYIQKLQQSLKDRRQHTHLGWTDDHSEFVLPHEVISANGTRQQGVMSGSVEYSARHVKRKGTLAKQVENLKFYSDPGYVRHQFMIGCALATPLFYMTGQFGVVLSIAGHSGASKSTGLYAAASLWGEGEHYTINGTNTGVTHNTRQHRIEVLSSLPVCVDEITYMAIEDAKNFVMAISQPGGRGKMDGKTNSERQEISSQKSTIALVSANGSLHEKLSIKNIAGTASSMRVLEIMFPRQKIHSKREADDFLRDLRENYGHIGPAFMGYVMQRVEIIQRRVIEMIRFIDERAQMEPHERFYSALIACGILGLQIGQQQGLLHFDASAVLKWILNEQLPAMRGAIASNYSDPIDMLTTYMNASRADTLVVTNLNGKTSWIEKPVRELGIRYEMDTLTAHISIAHLKSYCVRQNIPLHSLIASLEHDIGAKRGKMTLGKGIPELVTGQARTLEIDLKSEAILGKIDYARVVTADNVVELRKRMMR